LVNNFWKHIDVHGPAVGIHFRGTDKTIEAPRVSWNYCLQVLQTYLKTDGRIKAVFVASDEQEFVDFVVQSVRDIPIFSYEDYYRYQPSDDLPPYRIAGGEYEKGEDALVNALLLSRCVTLIRTTSFLSAFAPILNRELKIILLNMPYDPYLWYPEIGILGSSNTTYLPENPT
jgi:hypothetical protein